MTETSIAGTLAVWSVPECPFQIAYSYRLLDEVRRLVVEAYFSIPRGGAEIGGILLGRHEGNRVTIDGHVPLYCEHAAGPSFTLSEADEGRLAELLATAPRQANGLVPVGWYHSHTRSDIFLTEADLDIHNRHFPEPWQIALVIRPRTLQPARVGFFFREPDGAIRSSASYHEFVIEPVPALREEAPVEREVETKAQAAAAEAAPPPPPAKTEPATEETAEMPALAGPPVEEASVIPAAAEPPATDVADFAGDDEDSAPDPLEIPPEPAPAAAAPKTRPLRLPEPLFRPHGDHRPGFLHTEAGRSLTSGRSLWIALGVGAMLALGVLAFSQGDTWGPRFLAWEKSFTRRQSDTAPVPKLDLRARDDQGQLQLRWDDPGAGATEGVLRVVDGLVASDIPLPAPYLKAGIFTYMRHADHVDARLTVKLVDGRRAESATSFQSNAGPPAEAAHQEAPPPPPSPAAEAPAPAGTKPANELERKNAELARTNRELQSRNAELMRQRDELAQETNSLKTRLNAQTARAGQLLMQLEQVRKQQQRNRMANQIGESVQ